jgi:hypothetical protein
VVAQGEDTKKLGAFKRWLDENLWFFRPDPRAMSTRTDGNPELLDVELKNFASWYPAWIARDLAGALKTQEALKEVLLGFDRLQVVKSSILQAQFHGPNGAPPYAVDFGDLSEGQRSLCALWVLRHAAVQAPRTAVFDEIDNYVALRELQPWLSEVIDTALDDDGPQVWFISHHPELLDQLAKDHGVRFFRDGGGPTRIEPFRGAAGLTASEVIARGWTDA